MSAEKKTEIRIAVAALLIVIAGWMISRYCFQFMLIQGKSMMPTYHNFQLVLLNKYDNEYALGDVIAFRSDELKAVIVKRIVAVPGDCVCIYRESETSPGTLYVNGKKSILYPEDSFVYSGILDRTIELSDDEYIVIGDNIAESHDSRYSDIGIVRGESIIGSVVNGKEVGK